MDRQRIAIPPFDRGADGADQLGQRFGVTDARHVSQRNGVFGQQSRGHDGQRRVLVAGGLDRA